MACQGGGGYTLAPMNDAIIEPAPEIPSQATGLPQLSVIVPTFNERDNVTALYRRLEATLAGIPWEVVFVDDNSPGRHLGGGARPGAAAIPRSLHPADRRGAACPEPASRASWRRARPTSAVIDADLQHDEAQLPKMVALLTKRRSGTRGRQPIHRGRQRRQLQPAAGRGQRLATEVARRVLKAEIADPMSGFFMIRRDRFEATGAAASTQGFKILLDIVATAQGACASVEVPFTFGARQHGESKLDSLVALDFLGLVLAKLTDDAVSLRFLLFAMVGSTGLVVHLSALFIALEIFSVPFRQGAGDRRAASP